MTVADPDTRIAAGDAGTPVRPGPISPDVIATGGEGAAARAWASTAWDGLVRDEAIAQVSGAVSCLAVFTGIAFAVAEVAAGGGGVGPGLVSAVTALMAWSDARAARALRRQKAILRRMRGADHVAPASERTGREASFGAEARLRMQAGPVPH